MKKKLPATLAEWREQQTKPKRGRVKQRKGEMNKTEAAYAAVLEASRRTNAIAAYWFEAVTFKLGPDCRYTPDFLVQDMDGYLEIHEVKAGEPNDSGNIVPLWEDDAAAKVRMAAGKFPFRFRVAFLYKGNWGWKEIE